MPNGNIYDFSSNFNCGGNRDRNNTSGSSCNSGGHWRSYYILIR